MEADVLQGKWDQIRGDIKKNWAKLTDNDLDVIAGQRDKLEGLIQEKYGYSKAKVRREVDNYIDELDGTMTDVRSRVKSAVADAGEKLQVGRDRAKEALGNVADKAPEELVYVVQEYPWAILGAMLLVGVVVGLLIRSRNS
jgi:uncharacterized protein YjbJ (UPF0337 family)/ElaB/YqjD/DUF883 family membrane-anchored ribosome-binding protein